MSVYLIIADDAIVHRCDDRQFALGYAACHAEQTGEECEIYEAQRIEAMKGGAE